MYKVKINLVTMTDIKKFVEIVTAIQVPVTLTDGAGYSVNAKSMMGCVAALEWDELYALSDSDIYTKISEFAI